MLLQEYISLLLHNHDCVIVPEFGGFVTNYKSAILEEYTKKIHPPSKSILFNSHLTTNDGLLGNYIAIDQEIVYSESLRFITEEVVEWKNQLANNERIDFGDIGFLYQKNDKIQFEQSRETNLLLAAYGLRSVDFVRFNELKIKKRSVEIVKKQQPIEKEVEVIQSKKELSIDAISVSKISEDKRVPKSNQVINLDQKQSIKEIVERKEITIDSKPERKNVFGTVLKYSAAAVIVPILFYSYWIPMETDALDTKQIQFSDFNPIHKQAERTYDLRHDVVNFEELKEVKSWGKLTENIEASVYNFELLEDFYVPVSLQKQKNALTAEIDNTTVVKKENAKDNSINEVQPGSFHVISGCFSVQGNANSLVSNLNDKGFNAQILDKKSGLHRVSAGAYSTKDAAKSAVVKLEAIGFSGWVLKF